MNEKIFQIIGRILNVPPNEIDENSSPDTIKTWDSLAHMNLIIALEEELNVQFTDSQIIEMNSVGLILEVLKEIE